MLTPPDYIGSAINASVKPNVSVNYRPEKTHRTTICGSPVFQSQ